MEQLIHLCTIQAAFEKGDFDITQKNKLNNLVFSFKNNMQCIVVEKEPKLVSS